MDAFHHFDTFSTFMSAAFIFILKKNAAKGATYWLLNMLSSIQKGQGVALMPCTYCHKKESNAYAGINVALIPP